MPGDWETDTTEWPIAIVRIAGVPPEPTFEAFQASVDAVLDRRSACAIVIDMTGAAPDAERRRRTAEAMSARRADIERYVRVGAIVLPNALLRGVVTAVQWISRDPLDLHWESFATLAEARAFVRERLEDVSSGA